MQLSLRLPSPAMRGSPSYPSSPKRRWAPRSWLAGGVALVALWAWLWESPEQALIGRVEQAIRALDAADSATSADWEVFAEPATLWVGPDFEQTYSRPAAREAWRTWRAHTGLGVLELEAVEAELQPPGVKARLKLGTQPGDLHARSYSVEVFFAQTETAPGMARIAQVRLSHATHDFPEARP